MTKRELHHKPETCPKDSCGGGKCCQPVCRCRYTSWPIWFLYVLLAAFVIASPFLMFIVVSTWYINEDRPQPALVNAIYACANEGSIHDNLRPQTPPPGPRANDSDGWLEGLPPGPNPPPHPEGVCKEIKKIIHQSIDYCKECEEEEKVPPEFKPPLVLGGFDNADNGEGVVISVTDGVFAQDPTDDCAGDFITGITINRDGTRDTEIKGDKLDLPQFCPTSNDKTRGPDNNRRLNPAIPMPDREWELLERPRVHFARTYRKPEPLPPLKEIKKGDLSVMGGPYVVFIAKHLDGLCCDPKDGPQAKRDKHRVTVFLLYLDWVTEQPTIIEFDVEIERGKDVISEEDTVQLISNVRLDSINKQITFQIGQGARRIVIAGYDFSGQSTDSDVGRRRRSEEDTSGSYRIDLTDDGAVNQVYRLP